VNLIVAGTPVAPIVLMLGTISADRSVSAVRPERVVAG